MALLMPRPPQIATQAIVNALLEWRGDIAAAARSLGMARNSLYERIQRLGLNLAGFRAQGKPGTPITGVTGMPGNARGVGHAQQNAPAMLPSRPGGARLTSVQNEATAEATPVPIKTAPRRHQPIRIKPEQRDLLQRAAWDLQARFQAPTDENLILEQFIDEGFEAWLRTKLTVTEPRKGKGSR